MKHSATLGTLAIPLTLVMATALAEDIDPPPYRGAPGSTTQEWDFVTPGEEYGLYPRPDGTSGITQNPFGPGEGHVGVGAAGGWVAGGPGDGGTWYGIEQADFWVLNYPDAPWDTWKELRLQVTFFDPHDEMPPEVQVFGGEMLFELVGGYVQPLGDNWFVLVADYTVEPNPESETVVLWSPYGDDPQYGISEVVIDTICIPEPSAMLLLAAGAGLALLRRRKEN